MKILQILPELNVGGVETGTVDFAKYLVEHGHQSIVVSNGGRLVEELTKNGSQHYQMPVHKKNLWTMVRLIPKLRKIIVAEKVDIVHARSRVPAWIAFFACHKTNAQFITTCHGFYKTKIFSQIMGWAKLVIVPSRAIGRHMIDTYDVPAENIRCIPRSVDISKYQNQHTIDPNKQYHVVSIVGRLTSLKGHEYFLKAMAKLVRQRPFIKIWIIGDAPANKQDYKKELETLVHRLGLKNYVEFLGQRSDIPQLLTQTDVLVMSSTEPESFGRVILEAQAAGVPVVATQVGGVVDIIEHRQNGLLVLPKDTDAMADAVLNLLKDTNLAQRLVDEAKKKIKEQFMLEHMASSTIAVYEELLKSHNILVIKISALGDIILITASLKALRKKFPEAKIYCLVGRESRHVLSGCPYIDGVLVYDHKQKDKSLRRFIRLVGKLREYHFDKVIDFQNNRKSHLMDFLIFPRDSYGYNNGKWGFLLTQGIKNTEPNLAPVAHQFKILEKLGIPYVENNNQLELWPSKDDKKYIQEILDSEWLGNVKNIVGINLAASENWPTKNWPMEHIAELCDKLSAKNIRIVLTGLEKDRALANRILSLTKSKPSLIIGKTTVLQLAELIGRCKVYITPDSAPLHIAAAMKTPIISFFGPTSSKRHVPPARKNIIFEKNLSCQPCYSGRCKIMTHACMKQITTDEVLRTVKEILKESE